MMQKAAVVHSLLFQKTFLKLLTQVPRLGEFQFKSADGIPKSAAITIATSFLMVDLAGEC